MIPKLHTVQGRTYLNTKPMYESLLDTGKTLIFASPFLFCFCLNYMVDNDIGGLPDANAHFPLPTARVNIVRFHIQIPPPKKK